MEVAEDCLHTGEEEEEEEEAEVGERKKLRVEMQTKKRRQQMTTIETMSKLAMGEMQTKQMERNNWL